MLSLIKGVGINPVVMISANLCGSYLWLGDYPTVGFHTAQNSIVYSLKWR